ncbi:MAG: F-box protein [Desulfobacteraceae bacterium]|nr:F-box protein [Desulfobacteraceae bacterium]
MNTTYHSTLHYKNTAAHESQTQNKDLLSKLPKDIQENIISNLKVSEIGVVPRVCFNWKEMVDNDGLQNNKLWKRMYLNKLHLPHDTTLPDKNDYQLSTKWMCRSLSNSISVDQQKKISPELMNATFSAIRHDFVPAIQPWVKQNNSGLAMDSGPVSTHAPFFEMKKNIFGQKLVEHNPENKSVQSPPDSLTLNLGDMAIFTESAMHINGLEPLAISIQFIGGSLAFLGTKTAIEKMLYSSCKLKQIKKEKKLILQRIDENKYFFQLPEDVLCPELKGFSCLWGSNSGLDQKALLEVLKDKEKIQNVKLLFSGGAASGGAFLKGCSLFSKPGMWKNLVHAGVPLKGTLAVVSSAFLWGAAPLLSLVELANAGLDINEICRSTRLSKESINNELPDDVAKALKERLNDKKMINSAAAASSTVTAVGAPLTLFLGPLGLSVFLPGFLGVIGTQLWKKEALNYDRQINTNDLCQCLGLKNLCNEFRFARDDQSLIEKTLLLKDIDEEKAIFAYLYHRLELEKIYIRKKWAMFEKEALNVRNLKSDSSISTHLELKIQIESYESKIEKEISYLKLQMDRIDQQLEDIAMIGDNKIFKEIDNEYVLCNNDNDKNTIRRNQTDIIVKPAHLKTLIRFLRERGLESQIHKHLITNESLPFLNTVYYKSDIVQNAKMLKDEQDINQFVLECLESVNFSDDEDDTQFLSHSNKIDDLRSSILFKKVKGDDGLEKKVDLDWDLFLKVLDKKDPPDLYEQALKIGDDLAQLTEEILNSESSSDHCSKSEIESDDTGIKQTFNQQEENCSSNRFFPSTEDELEKGSKKLIKLNYDLLFEVLENKGSDELYEKALGIQKKICQCAFESIKNHWQKKQQNLQHELLDIMYEYIIVSETLSNS